MVNTKEGIYLEISTSHCFSVGLHDHCGLGHI